MKKRDNQKIWYVFVFALLILPAAVIPAKAESFDQSIYSTGLKSEIANEINISDVTGIMKDELLENGVRVQKRQGKYDILSFRLNTDATQLPNLNLSVYVNNIYTSNPGPDVDGDSTQIIEGNTQAVHVYAYNADGLSAQSSMALDFTLSIGWNDLNVTQLLHLMEGFGFVKFRIVAVQNWFEISEAKFSVININYPPVAVANGPYNGIATNPIDFRSDGSYDPDSDAITYLWDFGDGSTSTKANPTHTYTLADRYNVTLTVTDTYGNSDTDTTTATIFSETFETIRPIDAYNPEGWINKSNGYDSNLSTYTYKETPNAIPSISFGGSSSNDLINAWQNKSNYWYNAWLYITYEEIASGGTDDLVEIIITDQNENLKHTILPPTIGTPKKEFVQKLKMSDWGDGFYNIENLRVKVNGYKQKGTDNAESRVYDVRIDGDTSPPVKDYTRGAYISLPVDDSNLTTDYSPPEINYVDMDDSNRISQDSTSQYLIHQYKQKMPSHNLTIKWNGQINEQLGVEAYAQSFKPNNSGELTSVGIALEKEGLPNGYLRIRIKSELGGEVLAESKPLPESSLDISSSWRTFTFENPVYIAEGNTYYLEIWRDRSDWINYPQVTVRYCSNFDGSIWWRSGGSWSQGSYPAITFRVYINNMLDVNSLSCDVPVTPDRNITGLDWKNIYLETYNRTTSSWIQLDTDLYDGSTTDINLSGTVTSDDYFDDNGWIAVRVYASSNNAITPLATDLIDFAEAGGEIFVDPSMLDFGSIEIGQSPSMGLTLFNIGIRDLTLGTIIGPETPFSIISDGCSGQILATTASCPVTVNFTPTTEGIITDILTIPSNDINNPITNVNLKGTAKLPPATLTGTVTDLSSGLPLYNVSVTVIDSIKTHTTATDSNGEYTLSGLAQGNFTATFIKSGYIEHTASGTLVSGQTHTLDILLDPIPPLTITITSPEDGAVLNSSPISVTGDVSNNANVTVNGVQAIVSNNIFSASIPLNEGPNTITATAVDQYNQTTSDSITVTLIMITKGSIAGTVTNSSTGLPLPLTSVSVTDSSNITQTVYTSPEGTYSINSIASGAFNGIITKECYTSYTFSGTMSPGQTTTINAALNFAPPTISNITVSDITTNSATITWTTDQISDGIIEYGETIVYGLTKLEPAATTNHSVVLTGLKKNTTYHFKVTSTNDCSLSSSSGDNTFTTLSLSFTATTIGDYGNVTVIEVTGNYDAKNPDGSINTLPRQKIAKEFLKNHPDEYDFFVIFTNFDFSMPDADAKAFYLEVKNDTQGIGKSIFDNTSFFGSNGKLQGNIDMGNISTLITNPADPKFEETINNLAHEQLHRWAANVKFKDAIGNISTALLGKDGTH